MSIPTYVELCCRSAFSFLDGASAPEDLIDRAAALGYDAVAVGDRDGVYGAPRAYKAATATGLRALVGAELTIAGCGVYVLVAEPSGYRNLCRLITRGKLRAPKGECHLGWDDLEEHAGGLVALVGPDVATAADPILGASNERLSELDRLRALFGAEHLYVAIARHYGRRQERALARLVACARARGLPLVATNAVRHAAPPDRRLFDVLTCIRLKTTLAEAGRRLLENAERHVKSPAEMQALFRDLPEAVQNTRRIAERCGFTLANLGYRFPDFPLPRGETTDGHLRQLVFAGARTRYGAKASTARVRAQLEHELGIIAKLGLAGYFLIVWEIVEFCRASRILVQGRGSAANSAVCYALGITAVDPIGMELLFERFLSEERGEWPDIDLDLPSGDQRERVLQHVYQKYGTHGAAMTANVITYRTRSAVREVGKVLGFAPDQVDRLAKLLRAFEFRDGADELSVQIREAGLDPAAPKVRLLIDLVERIQHLPRHLGQHSGGMVMAAGRLDDVVPLEPASMPGRVVVQWDKDDCADLGIIKVDLLGLGMMAVLEEAIPLVREYDGVALDLAHLPPDDPDVYAMLQRADTVGVFQVESRAQMATLPRMRPTCFYDLVVEVAIIRPGPIVGRMVHPYLRRRAGREPVTYPHPSLEPVLRRTLGVPLFQEQLLRIAMTVAGFSGGEAEDLRRAMGFKRSRERMERIEARLRSGMATHGITGDAAETIIHGISSFALYGFPECVVGDTRVLDADTGRWVEIEDVVSGRISVTRTLALDADLRVRVRNVRGAVRSGRRQVFRLRTALGRSIEVTAEHPFLTVGGWRRLGELSVGDYVASARSIPSVGCRHWPSFMLVVLGDLIAEGNLCHPGTFYFYTTDPHHRDEFISAVEQFDNTKATLRRHRGCCSVHVRRIDRARLSGAVAWLKALGMWGLDSHGKRLPAEVFELDRASLSLLLARLWEGDGHISCAGHASYDTVSVRLGRDLQHVLLRLGIVARMYERSRPYRGRTVTCFTVTITGRANLQRFADLVAARFLGRGKREAVAELLRASRGNGRASRDIVPLAVRLTFERCRAERNETWADVARGAGISARGLSALPPSKRGFRRWVVGRLAAHFQSAELRRLASSDIYWDRVVSIEPVGERETYDLQIEGDHNFLANDFVVHNSHSASFALIAYASTYLKAHHPTAFYCAMLNNWPMGFYHPATLVKDAERHDVRVRPIDVTRSHWKCTIEGGALRLGLRYVSGLREETGLRIETERARRPFATLSDLVRRCAIREDERVQLARAGACAAFGEHRRDVLWQMAALERDPKSLLASVERPPALLPAPSRFEETLEDYAVMGLTTGPHVMAHFRTTLAAERVCTCADVRQRPDRAWVRVAGHVIVRQRPGTARGMLFLTLEDETGTANAVVTPSMFQRHRRLLHTCRLLLVEGPLQKVDGVTHVRAARFEALALGGAAPPSHDFR